MMFHGDYGDVPDAGVDGFVDGQKVCRLITVGAVDPLNRGALGQLAGVTLHVSARRAKFKLGQNRPMETPRRIITEPRKLGHIITIDVVPHRQRQHVGSRLLEEIESWLWAKGAEAIYLETAVDDSGARGFYERHGYFIYERLEGYYNGTLDAFLMMKTAKHSTRL